MKSRSFKYYAKIVLYIGFFIGLIGLVKWYQSPNAVIKDFNYERDREFILDIFKKNWYWLVSEYSTDFSAEYMLEHRASSKSAKNEGNLTIKTMYLNNDPVGFVAYYKKKFYLGMILFVAVREKYRSQGYGGKLLRFALDDLAKKGSTHINLVTRTNNSAAQTLYKKHGFKETSRNDGFVYFQYVV